MKTAMEAEKIREIMIMLCNSLVSALQHYEKIGSWTVCELPEEVKQLQARKPKVSTIQPFDTCGYVIDNFEPTGTISTYLIPVAEDGKEYVYFITPESKELLDILDVLCNEKLFSLFKDINNL